MHDKNERITLWLLAQEREKDRARARTRLIEETTHRSKEHSLDRSSNPSVILMKLHEEEHKQAVPSETTDLERLMNEKADLEEGSRRLDEEQKQLSLRVRILCEKLVQEMKKWNSEKQQAVNQMRAKIGSLEAQLSSLSVPDTPEKQSPRDHRICSENVSSASQLKYN